RCSAPKHKLAKVYRVTTKHPVSPDQISQLLAGVQLHDDPQPVLAVDCQKIAEQILDLTINEGKYHQVKRMLAAVGNRVEQLHRQRIGAYDLDPALAAGDWCWLDTEKLALISNSLFV
ncbi:MAG: 16S rRNA pseudouridine(516) synthase, partial [Herbaspirillum sp.]